MKKNILILFATGLIIILFIIGCKPRIDFDPGQYGDHAIISSVVCFNLDTASQKLQEYYQTGQLVPGVERITVAYTTQPVFTVVDTFNTTIAVYVPKSYDMTHMGFFFNTQAQKIVTMAGSPTPGILTDLTQGQPFKYRAVSSNGFIRTYTMTITPN